MSSVDKEEVEREDKWLYTVDRNVDCLGERGPDAVGGCARVGPFGVFADGYYGQRPVGELVEREAQRNRNTGVVQSVEACKKNIKSHNTANNTNVYRKYKGLYHKCYINAAFYCTHNCHLVS